MKKLILLLLLLPGCTRLSPDALPVEREHWHERPADLNWLKNERIFRERLGVM